MSALAPALEVVFAHEGGFVDDPRDAGGATQWGISLRFLRGLDELAGDVDGDGDVDAADVRLLTREDAARLYDLRFWRPLRLAELHDQEVATKVMDLAVNMGPKGGVLCLQRGLRACGRPVAEDGRMGSQSIAAANAAPSLALLAALRSEAAGRYREIVAGNQRHVIYLRGWLARAYD